MLTNFLFVQDIFHLDFQIHSSAFLNLLYTGLMGVQEYGGASGSRLNYMYCINGLPSAIRLALTDRVALKGGGREEIRIFIGSGGLSAGCPWDRCIP